MRQTLIHIVILVVAWLAFAALMPPASDVDLPMKKINRAISKVWKVEEFEVIDHEMNNEKNCFEDGCWLKVKSGDQDLGMIYVGRVNSCRSGGCSIDMDDNALSFEFFDYFLLADTQGEVLWVKVYNYEATQGHEVMSRGWLNQFKGLTKEQKLVFGQDIESISGATVSATAITENIQHVLSCVSN